MDKKNSQFHNFLAVFGKKTWKLTHVAFFT